MRRSVSWSLLLALAGLLAACTSSPAPATKPPPAAAGNAPAAAATTAPAASAPAAAAPAGPATVVKMGQVGFVGYPFYIGMDRGYYKEQGIELEYDTYRTGAEMVPMIAQGQIDISQQAVVPGTYNAALRGLPVKAILDGSHAEPGQHSHATLVRKELLDSGAVKSYTDLVGRKVASSSLPGGLVIGIDRALRTSGRRAEDWELTMLPFPDMPAALANGSIDAAVAVEPSITMALNQNSAGVLRWLSEDAPGAQIAIQLIGPTFIDRPDLARRFVVAYLRGARDWNDTIKHGVGVDELAQLLAPHNKLSVAVNADLLRRHGFTSIDPDGRINKESLAYDNVWYVEGGHLDRLLDLDQFVDMQYADYAVAQLGPYKPPR